MRKLENDEFYMASRNIYIMGFEQVVPPIPDRKAELEGIHRLEQSWLNQPYYKYYMNESLRQPKMAYADRINKTYSQFYLNLAISCFVLAPFTFLCRRFFIRRGGSPITFTPDYFNKFRPDNDIRRKKFYTVMIPSHLLGSVLLATYLTDWENILFDRKYEFLHKPPVMM